MALIAKDILWFNMAKKKILFDPAESPPQVVTFYEGAATVMRLTEIALRLLIMKQQR